MKLNLPATVRNWLARRKQLIAGLQNAGNWFSIVFEPFAGAWQQNYTPSTESILAYNAVYSCITLISSDIGKLPFVLERVDERGLKVRIRDQRFIAILKRPNRYQNHIQFKEWWEMAKLLFGNTYILKQRNIAGLVVGLYILDPQRVEVLVAPDGSVFYRLNTDNLSGIQESVTVPASEIIHDRINCLFHPLIGVSPIYACKLAAEQGLNIQIDSKNFFGNGANPSGILTAPGPISDDKAKILKKRWEEGYTGKNAGKVAVLGDDLKFEPMRMSSTDAQIIETLKWTAEVVCSVFHVPAYKVNVGNLPTYNNVEALTAEYYSQCLQSHIEQMEAVLLDGLELPEDYIVELDLDVLFRMDTATRIKTLSDGVGGALYAPNEARLKLNLPPLEGGDSVYMQQQNYSLEALARRDAQDPLAAEPAQASAAEDESETDSARGMAEQYLKYAEDAIVQRLAA